MSNWSKGAKIESEYLPDDTIVWIEWNDGLSGPAMLEDFREQGSTGGEVYNLRVQSACPEDKDRWDSIFK